jgi:hypothetical protein
MAPSIVEKILEPVSLFGRHLRARHLEQGHRWRLQGRVFGVFQQQPGKHSLQHGQLPVMRTGNP